MWRSACASVVGEPLLDCPPGAIIAPNVPCTHVGILQLRRRIFATAAADFVTRSGRTDVDRWSSSDTCSQVCDDCIVIQHGSDVTARNQITVDICVVARVPDGSCRRRRRSFDPHPVSLGEISNFGLRQAAAFTSTPQCQCAAKQCQYCLNAGGVK